MHIHGEHAKCAERTLQTATIRKLICMRRKWKRMTRTVTLACISMLSKGYHILSGKPESRSRMGASARIFAALWRVEARARHRERSKCIRQVTRIEKQRNAFIGNDRFVVWHPLPSSPSNEIGLRTHARNVCIPSEPFAADRTVPS